LPGVRQRRIPRKPEWNSCSGVRSLEAQSSNRLGYLFAVKWLILVDDLQFNVVDEEGVLALLEEHLHRPRRAVSSDLQDAAQAVLLVPYQQTLAVAGSRSLLGLARLATMGRRDRL